MYEAHRLASMIPEMTPEQYASLVEDIGENGLREPITLYEGAILDGRHRQRAVEDLAERGVTVKPQYREFEGDAGAAFRYVVSLNLHRRHLEFSQRAALAALYKRSLQESGAVKHGGDRTKQGVKFDALTGEAREVAAKKFNVSAGVVTEAEQVYEAAPDLFEQMVEGGETLQSAKREMKRRQAKVKVEAIEAKAAEPTTGLYDVIVVDPPWPTAKIERDVRPNQTGFDYPVMELAELQQLTIPAEDDCHLWLWTTHKFLPEAFGLLKAWNFNYVCAFVWHKPGGFQPVGLPQYNCEFALYARKGTPAFKDTKNLPVCFDAPRGAHSEKPGEFYEMVARVTAGRRLDMFNRRPIDGFDGWGNEAA